MFGLTAAQLLGLSVLAAIVTTIGNLLATVLKESVFVRSFELWKTRQATITVHKKYRDPLSLSTQELQDRMDEICNEFPVSFLMSDVLDVTANTLQANDARDPYFKKYKLVSTVYRLCAFLGWLELYRQELTFLDPSGAKERELQRVFGRARGVLADGSLNAAADFFLWKDQLIFREEQRAIGAAMITAAEGQRSVLGYGPFRDLFDRMKDDEGLWWLSVAAAFFLDPEAERDFRAKRFALLRDRLGDCVEALTV